jgi:hypothetical protein
MILKTFELKIAQPKAMIWGPAVVSAGNSMRDGGAAVERTWHI